MEGGKVLRLAETALNRPASFLGALLALTLLFGLGLSRSELRTDGAAIHPTGNPTVEASRTDRESFEDPEQVLMLLSSRPGGPAVASPDGFRLLERLHRSVDALPGVRAGGVRSLASLLAPPPAMGLPIPRTYLATIPDEPSELAALVERIREHPLADGLFLAADGRSATLYVPLREAHSRPEVVADLEEWIARQRGADFDLRLTGPVVAEVTLGRQILWDLAWLTPLMIALIAVLLWLGLGTVAGVVIPLVEVLVVLVWTLGAMAWLGVPVTLVTTILPVVLMAMAVADEIHLLERLEERLDSSSASGQDGAEKREHLRRATLAALDDVARPIVLTSLTTAAGFLSFLTASMAPVRHFGVFTALGILIAMVLTFTLIPSLIVLLPCSWFERRKNRVAAGRRPSKAPTHERWLARHERAGMSLGLLLLAVSVPGLLKLSVQDSWVDNFDPDSELVAAERDFNASFWGTYRFDVVLRGPREKFFEGPAGLELLEDFASVASRGPRVGGLVCHLAPLEILAKTAGHRGRVSTMPAASLARMMSTIRFFGRRIDLGRVLADDGRSARIRIFVNSPDYRESLELRRYLDRELASLVASREVEFRFSGDLPVAIEVVRSIVGNQLRSIAWTLFGVGLVLALAFRGLRMASIVLAPVVAATAMVFGGMGHGGLPLGIATSMFAALTIGVGVDFAIHFSHVYRRQRAAGSDHEESVLTALATSGKAIRWNAVVLSSGFLVLSLSALKPNHSLGILLAAAMVACYWATLLLLPTLLRREARSWR
ncbi:MAG: MMPL family transporter [bacterium]|nr:MMPL family transporter [bacterium]